MIKSIVEAILNALLSFFFARKDAQQQRADDRAAGAQDAAAETDKAIDEVADARANIPPPPDSADALVRELRERAARDEAARRRGSGP